jgi:restriction endonuclease Mrr
MAIPRASEVIDEVLRLISDGRSHRVPALREKLPTLFSMSVEEQEARLPSGRETRLNNRWRNAMFRMRRQNLIAFLPEDMVAITDDGRKILKRNS